MTGHVFHPGHHELHGITVVIETHGPRTYIGRFDSEDQHGLHLLDAGVHEATVGAASREDYVRRSAKFGVRAEHKHLVVPAQEVARITRLGEMTQ
jgi:hypothetical protein